MPFKIKRVGRNRFQLSRDGKKLGTAQSQKAARDIARRIWYAQSRESDTNNRS